MEERVRKGNNHISTCGGIAIGKAVLNGKGGTLTSPCKGPCAECMTDPTIRGTLVVQSEDEDGGGQPPTVVHFGGPEGIVKYCGNCPVVKEEPEEAPAQQWETRWQEFLTSVEDSSSLPEAPHFPQEPAPWNDTPAFLASFEQVAKAYQWPEEEWAGRLLPTLKGEAELAFSSLEDEEREDYRKVKAAILRGDTLNQEKSRQCFRRFCYQQADGPRSAYNQLQEFCRQWLKAERNSKEQILELLILEQFLTVLPPEIQAWVKKHHLQSGAQAVSLAEDYVLSWKPAVKEEQTPVSQVEGSPHLSQLEKTPSDAGQRLPPSWESEMEEDTDLSDTDWSGGGISKQKQLQDVSPETGDGFSHQEEVSESWDGEKSKKDSMKANQTVDNQKTHQSQSCYVCGKTYNLPLHLYKRIHKRGKLYRCSQCQKGSVPFRQSSSSGKTLKCLVCEKVFCNKKNLRRHQKTHTGAKPNIGSGDGFMTRFSHQKNHADGKLSLPPPEITVYLCGICEASFNSTLDLDAHQRIHKGQNPSERGKNSSQETDLRKHQETQSLEKPFECIDCGKRFVWMTSCNKHRRNHCGNKTSTGALLSDTCIQKEMNKNPYPSPEKLKTLQNIHRGEKTHQCTICEERFTDSLSLEEHKKMIHNKKNSAPLLQSHLSQHEHVHTQEMPSGSVNIGESFMLSLSFESQRTNREEKNQGPLLKSPHKHKCLECGRTFDRPSRLKQHQFIHSGERPYQCTDCGERFLWTSSLDVHKKRFHKQNKSYSKSKSCMCSECGRTFSGPTYLSQHQRAHTRGKPAQDVNPGESTTGGSSLDLHSTKVHDGKELVPSLSEVGHKDRKSFTCNICGRNFSQGSNLRKHQRLHTGEKPYQCTDCGERFMWTSSLNSHRKKTHKRKKVSHKKVNTFVSPECGKTFSGASYLAQHQQVHIGSTTCPTCGKNFNQLSDLKKHQRIHTGEKPYQCTDCGERFTWSKSLGLHRKNFHKGKKLVPVLQRITVIPGEFLLWSEMGEKVNQAKHVTRPSDGCIKEKPYKHTDSEESFISPLSLGKDGERKKAELSRSADKKKEAHTCSECKKSFEWASQLRRHLRVHSGEKPFQCPDCEECFTWSSLLDSHRMKAHTGNKPNACSECGKSFDYPSQLKKHQRTHTREKPNPSANSEERSEDHDTGKAGGAVKQVQKYVCAKCGKCYNKASKLRTHSRLHSGDKPFQCSECGERFMWNSGLYRHTMKIHKRTKPQPLLQRGSADGEEPQKDSRSEKPNKGQLYLLKELGICNQEKSYLCSECGKCFWKEANLTRHRQVHLRAKMCKYEYQSSSILKESLEKGESPHSELQQMSVQMSEKKPLQILSHQDEGEQISEEESLRPLSHQDEGEQMSEEESLGPLSHQDEGEQMSEEMSLQPLSHQDEGEQMSEEMSLQPLSHQDEGEQMSEEMSLQPLSHQDEGKEMFEEISLQPLSHQDEGEQMSEEMSLQPLSHQDEGEQMSEEMSLQPLSHQDEGKEMFEEISLQPLSHQDEGEQMSEEMSLQPLSHQDEGKEMFEEISLQPLSHQDEGEQMFEEEFLTPLSHQDEGEQMSEEESLTPFLTPLSHQDEGELKSINPEDPGEV
ncbi:zinc finger protein 850 [Anolis carolinensis]|uniref:zinc finger protein 850 n=1 Tax=Anolis carolinensis TaxID=28377 RepID=UPI002F2B2F8F